MGRLYGPCLRAVRTGSAYRPLLGREAEETLEGSSKLVVEDGVDDRVEEAVDVAEPDEEREQDRVEAADAGQLEEVVADARGVDDVEGEERNPAEQEHACVGARTASTTDYVTT